MCGQTKKPWYWINPLCQFPQSFLSINTPCPSPPPSYIPAPTLFSTPSSPLFFHQTQTLKPFDYQFHIFPFKCLSIVNATGLPAKNETVKTIWNLSNFRVFLKCLILMIWKRKKWIHRKNLSNVVLTIFQWVLYYIT